MSGVGPRLAAADLLKTVLEERRTLDEALQKSDAFNRLTGADRGLARAIVSGALRHLGLIDAALEPLLSRPLNTATPDVRALLRIGAAQSWVLEMPDHAVVSATVTAAKQIGPARRAAGFINAVLRKVVADNTGFASQPPEQIWPIWLRTLLVQSLGPRQASRLAEVQLSQPATHLTPRTGDFSGLAAHLKGQIIGDHSVQIPAGPVDLLPGFAEGAWWVQDIAASLPARILSPKPGQAVLDLCAAPGGKTLQLAALGAKVTAVDRSQNRLKRLHENLERLGFTAQVDVVVANVESLGQDYDTDAILLDAPCSALGTLRRHPEGAWIKTPQDIARFPEIQKRLLVAALTRLKPAGTLIYCVCTPLPMEGVDVIDSVLAQMPQIKRVPITTEEVPGFEPTITNRGDVLTLPNGVFAHDAFYIARLQRVAAV